MKKTKQQFIIILALFVTLLIASSSTPGVFATQYNTTTTLNALLVSLATSQTGISFSGTVTPQPYHTSNLLKLNYSTSATGPSWTTAATVNVASGAFSGTFTAPATAGVYYFRAYFVSDSHGSDDWHISQSAQQIITVYGALDHFTLSTISSPQTAGFAFTLTITAKIPEKE
jgi:hypothetical protein